jgi:aminopeptidase N
MENLTGINSRLISNVTTYEHLAGSEEDIPPMIPSVFLSYVSYRNSAYDRPSIAYEILRDMIGDEIFIQASQEFMNRWKGKHPMPYDFFFTFNEITKKNLNWFWNPWFFERGFPDLAIDKVNLSEGKVEVIIKLVGIVPVPVKLSIYYEDESSEILNHTADVWKDGNEIFTVEIKLKGILKEIQLGDINIPDSNRENNLYLVH